MADLNRPKRSTRGLRGRVRAAMLEVPSFDLRMPDSPSHVKRRRSKAREKSLSEITDPSCTTSLPSTVGVSSSEPTDPEHSVPAQSISPPIVPAPIESCPVQRDFVEPQSVSSEARPDLSTTVLPVVPETGDNSDSESDMPLFPSGPPPNQDKSSEFFSVDQGVLNRVLNDKSNPSERVDNWCRNRFKAWRAAKGMDTSKTIEYYWDHLKELGEILTVFFLEVAKRNGQRYPTESLMGLYNAFNRILCAEQRKRCIEHNRVEPVFEIEKHPFFLTTNRAVNESMTLSVNAGANKGRKKARGLTFEDEIKILSHPSHQVTFARGLLKRLVYYCTIIFYVRGNTEMYNLLYSDFERGVNSAGFTYIK